MIDETGASQMLLPEAKRRKTIGVKEIEDTIATMARIPPKTVSKDDAEVLRHLDESLKRVVYGQDKAIERVASAIKLARAGLREPEKPIGSYLFSGPTGVGKTEVARQLATALGVELLRFDMSEYMERHTVSRLIGAPPGYVGFDQGGLLTDGVDQHPHCVLLLDEIEKAHPDLFNILLQVMDHGKLTDHNGKSVDFRNVILIMTTNAGAADLAKAAIGFGKSVREGDDQEAINRLFTPEFRNRLDAIVAFGNLPPEVVHQVVQKFVLQLEAQLADRGVTFDLSEEADPVAGREGLRQPHGCAPARPRHPGAHQAAARRRGAVRQAEEGRHRQGDGQDERGRQPQPRPRGDRGRAGRRRSPSRCRSRDALPRRASRVRPGRCKKPPADKPDGGGGKRGLVPKVPLKTS